jgi:hypothetical protein
MHPRVKVLVVRSGERVQPNTPKRRQAARYRIEHHLPDHAPGLGPEPNDSRERADRCQAANVVRQVQQRLGREITPGLEERGVGREI